MCDAEGGYGDEVLGNIFFHEERSNENATENGFYQNLKKENDCTH